jgi:hypothetical protein
MDRLTFGDLRLVVRFFTEGHEPIPGVQGTKAWHLGPAVQSILLPVQEHRAWARVRVWSRDRFGRHPDQEVLTELADRLADLADIPPHRVPEMPLDTVAELVKRLSDGPAPAQPGSGGGTVEKVSLDARALGLFVEDPNRTKKDIAKILRVRTQSLAPSRCPKLDAAMRAYRAPDPGLVRGSKDRDGNLEAFCEDEGE